MAVRDLELSAVCEGCECPGEDLGRKASRRGGEHRESSRGQCSSNSVSRRFTRSASVATEKKLPICCHHSVYPGGEPCMASVGPSELLIAPETLTEKQICTEHV